MLVVLNKSITAVILLLIKVKIRVPNYYFSVLLKCFAINIMCTAYKCAKIKIIAHVKYLMSNFPLIEGPTAGGIEKHT